MPAPPVAGRPWQTPYFAPSTIVVGVVVIVISILAGRYTGGLIMSREAARYGTPPTVGAPAQVHPSAARTTVRLHTAQPASR